MSGMTSQITSLKTVYSTVYPSTNQRKHQRSAHLAFVRGFHWWQVTRKMFPFDDIIMKFLSGPGPMLDSWASCGELWVLRPCSDRTALHLNFVSNHRQLHCLFNRFFRHTCTKENINEPRYRPFVRGIHMWLVDSPHKGPVTWKISSWSVVCKMAGIISRPQCVKS